MKLDVDRTAFMKGVSECSNVITALKAKDDKGNLVKLLADDNKLKFEMVYGNGSALATIDANVATPGEMLIDSGLLVRTGWSNDKLQLESTDENQLGFKCGKLKGNYDLSAAAKEFEALRPLLPKGVSKFKLDADALKDALGFVRYDPSLAQDANPSVRVTLTNKRITVKSTDTYGGAHAQVKASNDGIEGETSFIIMSSVLEPALEPFGGIIVCRQSKKSLTLSNKTFRSHVPLSRAMVGDIQAWLKSNVTIEPHCTIEVIAKEFLEALNGVKTLARDTKTQVVVDITPNKKNRSLTLHAAEKGLGELSWDLRVNKLISKGQSFAVGASLFNKFFKCFGNKTLVTLRVYDKVVHMVIEHAEYLFPTNVK